MVSAMGVEDSTDSLHVSTERTTTRRTTARSILLSVLLGSDPPRLPVQLLVRTTELFGIAEGTTRTALSRMATAGEVVAEDGWYALAADRLLARQVRQSASRAARTRAWRGQRWRQAVVVADGRRPAADRSALRATLAAARLAELREGVWLRPDNVDVPSVDAPELRWSTVVPDGDAAELAAELWELPGWAAEAARLRRAMGALLPGLERGDRTVLADGFVLSADVLRHFQADPLLPAELLPDGWPGADLRREYDRYDRAYRSVLRAWFRATPILER
jgi:phenylacetic acid degradation operon negative regulatory protein